MSSLQMGHCGRKVRVGLICGFDVEVFLRVVKEENSRCVKSENLGDFLRNFAEFFSTSAYNRALWMATAIWLDIEVIN